MKVSKHVNVLCVCALLVAIAFSATVFAAEPVKIFILAGQSNMLGQGNMSPVETQGTLEYIAANDSFYDFLKDGGGSWVVRDDVWITDQDPTSGGLTVGYGSQTTTIGPELGFGHFVGDLYEKRVLIVKAAWGGKSLAADFRPPSSGGTTGYYYNEVLRLVNDAIDNLETYVPGYNSADSYEIAGFGWHQGYNDKIDTDSSAEYEANMVNFIKDIRAEFDIPDLPFVIATTGMGGGATYSVVELAQLAMADATAHPEFDGNVSVIDTRIPYEDLEFWQPAEYSPTDQGYHWNRNAKTYVNIGRAMADLMSTMAPSRCPSRLRAEGAAGGGVTLTWQNGVETPTSVRILRNSIEIAAAAPVNSASFFDAAAQPGVHGYELIFTMPVAPCDPLTRSFNGGITDLQAYRDPAGAGLAWVNNMAYDGIEIKRNGTVIVAALVGSSISYIDTSPPSSGLVTYTVVPTNGIAAATEVQINLDGPPTGNAVIYEPFDYDVGGLNLQSSNSEVGLDGQWFANSTTQVTAGTLTFGDLPVGGAKLSDFTASQNRFGGSRAIRVSALAGNGLLDDGATLWFSALMGLQDGANRTNSNLGFALAAGPFGGGNGDWFISGGTGIGLKMGAGKPTAAFFPADSGGVTAGSFSGHQLNVPELVLIVGKITWGGAVDTIELYQLDTDLVLPATPISTLTTNVDQSTFDTLTFRRGDKPLLDEIRFGASYDHVIGSGIASTAPVVKVGKDMITWSGRYVELASTVTNKYGTDLTYKWSASSAGVNFSDDEGPAPTVTITNTPTSNPTTVTITLAVNNKGRTEPDVENTLEIDVYDDVCKATIAMGLAEDNPTDLNGDCITDLRDFAVMAAAWLNDTKSTGPLPR